MSDQTITSLIQKLEGAEVGSRELDAHVWASVNGYELFEHDGAGWRYRMHPDDIMRHERTSYISPVTTSLDAALALAERLWPHVMWRVGHDPDDGSFKAQLVTAQKPGDPPAVHTNAATPALTLCAAILRAKQ